MSAVAGARAPEKGGRVIHIGGTRFPFCDAIGLPRRSRAAIDAVAADELMSRKRQAPRETAHSDQPGINHLRESPRSRKGSPALDGCG